MLLDMCEGCEDTICENLEGEYTFCCICYEVEPNQMCDECIQDWQMAYDTRVSYSEIDNLRRTM